MTTQTHISKSQKFNQMVATQETLACEKGGRIFKVWFDMENQEWVLEAGYDYMPTDYTETHTDLATLEASMREVANFRRWTWFSWE